jgi:hypothetical protein
VNDFDSSTNGESGAGKLMAKAWKEIGWMKKSFITINGPGLCIMESIEYILKVKKN